MRMNRPRGTTAVVSARRGLVIARGNVSCVMDDLRMDDLRPFQKRFHQGGGVSQRSTPLRLSEFAARKRQVIPCRPTLLDAGILNAGLIPCSVPGTESVLLCAARIEQC